MTIDKTKYEAVLVAVTGAANKVDELSGLVEIADPDSQFYLVFNNIFADLASVEEWVKAKILEADQEQVMNDFLGEMKLVFDKYTAKIEVGNTVDGYGIDYGNSASNVGVKFTATFGGVTAIKEINKAVIVSGDLI